MRATVRTGIWSTLLTAACGAAALTLSAQAPRQVDDATLLKPPDGEWITYGRDYAETHHSPLKQIDQTNVARLGARVVGRSGLAGQDRDDAAGLRRRALRHLDVELGLRHRPADRQAEVAMGPGLVKGGFCRRRRARLLRPGESRRGALQGPRLRRPARRPARRAERADRTCRMGVQTTPAGSDYTITGAPRDRQGQGGDRQRRRRVRRARLPRRPTTPTPASRRGVGTSCPAIRRKGFEDEAMERAAKTWAGEWWKTGGGGTPWDGIAYDPELNLIYVGTGNGSPWSARSSQPGRRRQPLSVVDRRAATPTPASTCGTTRRRPATTGTSTPRSR